ncbi:MAG: 4'-phosphopantetheinyl transferase superfamily protein [Ruminococcaceae bacterium]|nr:4'-phosphopantetheinyl transferase superfamily protein [Oscillospiraceae bacterium]
MSDIKIFYMLTESVTEPDLNKALSMIPDWRREKVLKCKNFNDRVNGAYAYLILQYLIKSEFGAFDAAPFRYGEKGKPYFSKSPLFFSISHSKCAVGAAVCEIEIGFDTTDHRNVREELAERICTHSELTAFQRSNDKQRFLRQLWCKKESHVKRTGDGFSKGFTEIDTSKEKFFVCDTKNFCMSVNWEKGENNVEIREIDRQELL